MHVLSLLLIQHPQVARAMNKRISSTATKMQWTNSGNGRRLCSGIGSKVTIYYVPKGEVLNIHTHTYILIKAYRERISSKLVVVSSVQYIYFPLVLLDMPTGEVEVQAMTVFWGTVGLAGV